MKLSTLILFYTLIFSFGVNLILLSSNKKLGDFIIDNQNRKNNKEIKKLYRLDSKFKFIQLDNPDQVAGDSVGGDNGEFLRRNQPQEHIIIPLINTLEAEYNSIFAPDIKNFRKEAVKPDKGVKFKVNISKELDGQVQKLLN